MLDSSRVFARKYLRVRKQFAFWRKKGFVRALWGLRLRSRGMRLEKRSVAASAGNGGLRAATPLIIRINNQSLS